MVTKQKLIHVECVRKLETIRKIKNRPWSIACIGGIGFGKTTTIEFMFRRWEIARVPLWDVEVSKAMFALVDSTENKKRDKIFKSKPKVYLIDHAQDSPEKVLRLWKDKFAECRVNCVFVFSANTLASGFKKLTKEFDDVIHFKKLQVSAYANLFSPNSPESGSIVSRCCGDIAQMKMLIRFPGCATRFESSELELERPELCSTRITSRTSLADALIKSDFASFRDTLPNWILL